MSKRLIRNALLAPLATIDELPKLIKENEIGYLTSSVNETVESPYCRTSIPVLNRTSTTVGEQGVDLWSGVFQIDLMYPPNTGSDGADWMADRIAAAYPQKLFIDAGTFSVHVLTATPEFSRQNTNEYMSVVSVAWEAYIQR